jgi:hypothetical protein
MTEPISAEVPCLLTLPEAADYSGVSVGSMRRRSGCARSGSTGLTRRTWTRLVSTALWVRAGGDHHGAVAAADSEVAERLTMSRSKVYQLIQSGVLPSVRI